jgi:iron complex transport system substrate-binding protein
MKNKFNHRFHGHHGINFFYLLFIICHLLSILGCSRFSQSTNQQPENLVIQRIISAAPSNTEIIVGLGLADKLIAIDPYSKDIAGIPTGLPAVDLFYPDTEAIIAMKPDIIIANEINSFGSSDAPYKMLATMGIKIKEIPTSTTIEGIYGDIAAVADALDATEKGEELAAAMKAEIEAIIADSPAGPKIKTYFEVAPAPSMVSFGKGTYLNEMIELSGGENIFAADVSGWFTPSAEQIIARNPAVIFITNAENDAAALADMKSRPGFSAVDAVKKGRVYAVDQNSASRPSQHIVTAFRQIAQVFRQATEGHIDVP